MGYPYGQPGNSGYGPYPGPGYPQPGYPQAGYPQPGTPPRKPGGGTAITAGVLATIHGLLGLLETVAGSIETRQDRHDGYSDAGGVVLLIVVAVFTGLYLCGAILFFFRRRVGRYLIIGASGLILLGGVGAMVYSLAAGHFTNHSVAVYAYVTILIVLVLESLTLGLAAASSTGRWIAARTAAPVFHHQPATGYAQQPYPPH